jgi:SOS-response transcriptional repressor LexA
MALTCHEKGLIFMSHPTTTAIELYALSRLDDQREREVENHLLACASCRARLSPEDDVVRFGFGSKMTVGPPSRSLKIAKILNFRTRLPLYSLEATAGKFGTKQEVVREGWAEVQPDHGILTNDMFVTHVEGRSMQPKIPDGSLCAFRSNVSAPYHGKVLLLERYGETGGNRYTVSQYRISKNIDSHKEGDREWLHERFTLEPLNPEFPPWDVASDEKVNVIGEFVFVVQGNSADKPGLVS